MRRLLISPPRYGCSVFDIPHNARFIIETHPETNYDLTTLRLWTDGSIGHLELYHFRMTGVLGESDGTLPQSGLVSHDSILAIQEELEAIGFWDLNPKLNTPKTDAWWYLAASDRVQTHFVERFSDNNEIASICRRCYGLVDWDNLHTGPFEVS